MTTAARPTYYAAIGKQEYGGLKKNIISAKDQIAHTKLKFRQPGQNTVEEVQQKDLRSKLEEKELQHEMEKDKTMALLLQEEKKADVSTLLIKDKPDVDADALRAKYDDADIDEDDQDDDGFDSSR